VHIKSLHIIVINIIIADHYVYN